MKRRSNALDGHHARSSICHSITDDHGNVVEFTIKNKDNNGRSGIFIEIATLAENYFKEDDIPKIVEWLTKSLESIADIHREEYEKS